VITQEEDGKHVFGLALAGMWMAVGVVVSSDSWGLCARNEDDFFTNTTPYPVLLSKMIPNEIN
jgi:hypothetical protein